MTLRNKNRRKAFTLIEILLAMGIFALVLTSMYSSWSSILRASKAGSKAAEDAQRGRAAMRVIQDALVSAQMFTANQRYYSFVGGPDGTFSSLSFASHLPESFPRSSRFGGLGIRRVNLNVERGKQGQNQLVVRQTPLCMDTEEDEQAFPVVLAKEVKLFQITFWDQRTAEWVDEWLYTNQLPKLVRVTLAQGDGIDFRRVSQDEVVTRIISIPSVAVPAILQVPGGVPGAVDPSRTNNSLSNSRLNANSSLDNTSRNPNPGFGARSPFNTAPPNSRPPYPTGNGRRP